MQVYLSPEGNYAELDRYLSGFRRALLVCGSSFCLLTLGKHLQTLEERGEVRLVRFSGFSPNPCWEEVNAGIAGFQTSECGLIVAAGGGSAMDTAKCIRHSVGRSIPLLAIPTTAGSGSEATHFAVVYRNGIKESVDCGLPDVVMLDASTLETLPDYQRKATMLDALCHAVESFWSVNATPDSMDYSERALEQIMRSYQGYLCNIPEGNAGMLRAAHTAGKAINIARTTAGHAMCYQLTKLYGLAHGHAAALCVSVLWPYLLTHVDQCIHPLGRTGLGYILERIARTMGCSNARAGAECFQSILNSLGLKVPAPSEEELAALTAGVNAERLKNFPVMLCESEIQGLYREILSRGLNHEN